MYGRTHTGSRQPEVNDRSHARPCLQIKKRKRFGKPQTEANALRPCPRMMHTHHTHSAHTPGGQEENHPPGSPGIVYIYKWFYHLGIDSICILFPWHKHIYNIYNTITDKILLMRMDIPGRGYPENGSSFLFPYKGSNYC